MANLRLQNVIAKHLEEYPDTLPTPQKFIYLILNTIFDLDDTEVEQAYTDGPRDKGIDAIFEKESEGGNRLYLIQSKHRENPEKTFEEGVSLKLFDFVDNYLIQGIPLDSARQELVEKFRHFQERVKNGAIDQIVLVTMTNGQRPSNDFFNDFKARLVKYRGQVDWQLITEDSLFDYFYAESTKQVPEIEIQVLPDPGAGTLTSLLFPKVISTEGYVTKMDICQLAKIVENNQNIFNKNVRSYQSIRNKVNKQIASTLRDEKQVKYFCYLNNGITILCSDVHISAGGFKYTLKNPSIINGCQTANTIFEVYKEGKLVENTAYVLVRIIKTSEENLAMDIIKASNTQTAVRARDLVSEDSIQKELEKEFETYGYYYERKKNMHMDKPRGRRLDLERAAQFYLSMFLFKPAEAKNKKSQIYGAYYEQVFNKGSSAKDYLLGLLFNTTVDELIKKSDEYNNSADSWRKGVLLNARLHILSLIKKMLIDRDADVKNYLITNLKTISQKEMHEYFDEKLKDIIDFVIKRVEKISKGEDNFNPQYFFKSPGSLERILEKET